MTKTKVLSILDDIPDVESIRYIVLSQKECNHNINDIYDQYTVTLLHSVPLLPNFHSTLCILNSSLRLIGLARHIVIRLVYSMPCTPNGITIAADKPGSNNWVLNISRPGVLRQIYGLDIRLVDGNLVERYAYGLGTKTLSEGTDPCRVSIKPFCDKLGLMSVILHSILLRNKRLLNLQNVNLINKFNSCVILQYFTMSGLKQQCAMGWHCDSKYSKKGNFLTKILN